MFRNTNFVGKTHNTLRNNSYKFTIYYFKNSQSLIITGRIKSIHHYTSTYFINRRFYQITFYKISLLI